MHQPAAARRSPAVYYGGGKNNAHIHALIVPPSSSSYMSDIHLNSQLVVERIGGNFVFCSQTSAISLWQQQQQ